MNLKCIRNPQKYISPTHDNSHTRYHPPPWAYQSIYLRQPLTCVLIYINIRNLSVIKFIGPKNAADTSILPDGYLNTYEKSWNFRRHHKVVNWGSHVNIRKNMLHKVNSFILTYIHTSSSALTSSIHYSLRYFGGLKQC